MHTIVRGLMAACLAMAFVVSGAEAQLTPVVGLDCSVNDFTPTATACAGAFAGNNEGESDPSSTEVLAFINATWGPGFTDQGTTEENSSSGPFGNWGNDESSGELQFDNTIFTDFVVALKAAKSFSLYYFASADFGPGGISSLEFETYNSKGLSHATLYTGETVTVPEPGTMLLLATGLLGLGMIARRREGDSIA